MLSKLNSFRSEEDGAVTVDWVVLTAAVCGMALAAFGSIQTGSKSVGDRTGTYLTETQIESLWNTGEEEG